MLHFLLQDLDFFFFFIQLACIDSTVFSKDAIFFQSFLISDACETCFGLEDTLEAFEGRGFFCADGSVSGDSGRGL